MTAVVHDAAVLTGKLMRSIIIYYIQLYINFLN